MMRFFKIIILCSIITACASTNIPQSNTDEVIHIVLIWLKQPGNDEHINQIITATQHLKTIPQIKKLHIGESISSDRKIVDDSFDIGLYMIFANKSDMETYLTHPRHKHVVETTFQPLVSKILVYDLSSIDN